MYRQTNHVFLYHAHAVAAGGWVKRTNGEHEPIESVAPSALLVSGGYSSNSARGVNFRPLRSHPFGSRGPSEFFVHIRRAFTEVRGYESDEENPFGAYVTTMRSVLEGFSVNDVLEVEYAEAVLTATHDKPNRYREAAEARILVGSSSMHGLHVSGKKVGLEKHDTIDDVPTFGGLREQIRQLATAGKSGPANRWIEDLADWNDLTGVPDHAPQYAKDLSNPGAERQIRLSLFKGLDAPQLNTYKASIDVENFGRIFPGEIFASPGMKHMTMLRLDLGCDNCGGVGGSGGSTNGGPVP